MKMTNNRDDDLLEAVFAAARADMANAPDELAPSDDLLNRIMLDADAVLAGPDIETAQPAPQSRAQPKRSALRTILAEVFGGWPTFAGLAAATVTGLWIGVAPPAALGDFTETVLSVWADETIELPLWGEDVLAAWEG